MIALIVAAVALLGVVYLIVDNHLERVIRASDRRMAKADFEYLEKQRKTSHEMIMSIADSQVGLLETVRRAGLVTDQDLIARWLEGLKVAGSGERAIHPSVTEAIRKGEWRRPSASETGSKDT